MANFDASKILVVEDFKGETMKEKMEYGYKKIGEYLINHAKDLAADSEPNISEIELNVKIRSDYVVTLEKKTNYYITNCEEN